MSRYYCLFLFVSALGIMGAMRGVDDHSLGTLVAVVSDPDIPHEVRAVAEHTLMERDDPEALRFLLPQFDNMKLRLPPMIQAFPDRGLGPEGDAHRPPSVQVYHAQRRLWRHFTRESQPEEDRKWVFAELFDQFETDYQFRQLIDVAIWNHSQALEEKLWSLFANRENDPNIRGLSAGTLSRVTGVHSQVSLIRYRRKIVEYAWEERGSEVATIIGGRFGGPRFRHPYLNALKLDWYERERDPETRRSRMRHDFTIDRMDTYFGNISGLYRDPRARRDELIDKRAALQREARETGDETKLREFEAEVAEQQREELEQRIERIDAWIAENRDRLEREAEEFAEQRAREREQAEQRR